jgi:ABC-type bacteriocin/lantibiotic exporter with double-glycine peptidase domain
MGGAAAYRGADDHPGSPWYTPFEIYKSPDQSYTFIQVPTMQQQIEFTCGAVAVIMNLRYYGQDGDELEIASQMNTVPVYGADVGEMTGWFEDRGWIVNSSNTDGPGDLDLLQKNLKEGKPTLVAWADWGGHWMVVTGYNNMGTDDVVDDVIVFADPYYVTDHKQDGGARNFP